MSTPSKTKIINVTTDVFDKATAIAHFREELQGGNYLPFLHVRFETVRGKRKLVYNVCRVPTDQDAAFVADQIRWIRKYKITRGFVSTARFSNLCLVTAGRIVRPK